MINLLLGNYKFLLIPLLIFTALYLIDYLIDYKAKILADNIVKSHYLKQQNEAILKQKIEKKVYLNNIERVKQNINSKVYYVKDNNALSEKQIENIKKIFESF